MKRLSLIIIGVLCFVVPALAQPAANYYTASTLDGKSGRTLELALKAIVYPHTQLKYNDLWTAYKTTDPGPSDSIPAGYSKTDLVYDMYAWMQHFPKFYSDNDHTQTSGINREHCVPNSWWGGESGNAICYTDLHHLVPSDGCANNAKSNWPLGEFVQGMTLTWPTTTKTNTSNYTYVVKDTHVHVEGDNCKANASHVWKPANSSSYGGASSLYEPADEYKGDFARMYLYVVCAYEEELTWQVNYMFTSDSQKHHTILDWAKELLLKWHRQDPVSDKERNRNNAVYSLQNNRNPFIDYPDFVEYIWGNKSTASDLSMSALISAYSDKYNQGEVDPGTDPEEPEEPDTDGMFAYESFDQNTGDGGNDDKWSGVYGSTATTDNEGWDFTNGYGANACIKLGSSSKAGVAITPKFAYSGNLIVKFRAGAWKDDATTLKLSTTSGTLNNTSVTIANEAFTDCTVRLTAAEPNCRLTISSAQDSKNRFFLDEVRILKYGDVNGDGNIDIQDVTTLVDLILGKITSVTGEPDIDGDGNINITDVTALVDIILGK